MIKLNKKGMTTVEVLVCFVLIVVLVVSMYSTVSAYSAKKNLESNREEIIRYKNIVTKDIMSDLTINGLVSAHSDQIKDDKSVVPSKIGDVDVYEVDFTLRGGQARKLIIERRLASSNESHGYRNETQFFLRGDYNCDGTFTYVDCAADWTNEASNCLGALDFSVDKNIVKNELCSGSSLRSKFENITINSNTAQISQNGGPWTNDYSILPNGGQAPYSKQVNIEVVDDNGIAVVDNNSVDDYFSINYNGISYPLPDIGSSENDNGHKVYDLRLTDVEMSVEGKVFYLRIILQHRDFGNKYSINIVCPYNF